MRPSKRLNWLHNTMMHRTLKPSRPRLPSMRRLLCMGTSLALATAVLAGCADRGSYPNIANIPSITQPLMSADEQKARIETLTLEQRTHAERAERTITGAPAQ